MRKKQKKGERREAALQSHRPFILAYPSDMASTAISALTEASDGGPERILALCQQLMGQDGEFVLASLVSGFSVSDLRTHDPKLSTFRDSFRASLKDNPRALFSLIGMLKKAVSQVQSASANSADKAVIDDLTDQFKKKFGL